MKISAAFPSKWLKAEDIGARRKVKVTIDSVVAENIGDEDKLVIYFLGKTKGLVLNKTNAGRISAAHGDETDDWSGKEIFLFVEQVLFSGRMVPAIRVDVPMETVDESKSAPPPPEDEPPF
jgi:hypothetical protein